MCTNKVPTAGPNGQVIYRPCGKCLECLRQYQQDWAVRLSEEFKAWEADSVIFFTLTYEDAMLPVQVNFQHPITQSFYQTFARVSKLSIIKSHLSNLGLDSFFYTRDYYHLDKNFLDERAAIEASYKDMPLDEKPAIIVPTVLYDDVNTWIRYCRKYFSRHVTPIDYHGRKVSPYLKSLNWDNGDFPDSAYTPSFKYFITSEYGPATLRPHYHGVLAGVPSEMFKVFAEYWINTFGDGKPLGVSRSVKFSVYDPSKGGALYIAKYCSKGSFDHPLTARSVIYPSGKEFVSRHYLNCVAHFDIDEPFCVPTFRVMSKGIGIRYPFNCSIQEYWGVRCDASTAFVTEDAKPLSFTQTDALKLADFMKSRKLVSELLNGVKDDFVDARTSFVLSSHELFKFDQKGKVIGLSFLTPYDDDDDRIFFQNYMFNKKFVRCYVQDGIGKVYKCLLPRFYRRFLLSPFTQFALETAVHRKSEFDYDTKRKVIESQRQKDSYEALLEQVSTCSSMVANGRQKDSALRQYRFYSKLFAGDR